MNQFIKTLLFFIVVVLVIFLFTRLFTLGGGLISEFLPTDKVHEEEYEDDKSKEKIYIVGGYKAIRLDKEVIDTSGIKSEQLSSIIFKPEFTAYAEVINIAPLVSARTEYMNLLAEQKVLQNDLHNHHKILKRAEALHETNSLTIRELEKIRAEYDFKLSGANALKTRIENFTYQLKSDWGAVIGSMILEQEKQSDFNKLASHQASLILLSLLKSQTLTDPQQKVFISSSNKRETAIQASYLDRAKQISNPFYGESHIYLLEMEQLSAGTGLYVWIEEYGEPINGYFVPESAVIWYANEPWIYIKHDDDLFVRVPLGDARQLSNGWLLKELQVNDTRVVTSGGQTLLSEEFKWAIPDEDAD